MKTTVDRLAEHFEDLRTKAPTMRDVLYLDGVLAVIDQYKENEDSDPQIDWNYVLRFNPTRDLIGT